ncbi:MAG: hypothetical protein AB7I19_18660 [Planctomycetota bacterium]
MSRLTPSLLLLLSLSLLPAAMPAQDLGIAESLPIHELRHDDAPPQVWAAGGNYKVSFHDGMTFIPYLGSDYPHNQPFGWRTVAVTVGEQNLLVDGDRAVLWHRDFRAEYRFANVIEAYDVRPEGLEQTFVLKHRPASPGALRIRGAVATALRAVEAVPAQQKLEFADAQGRKILNYGEATAIDANGRHFPVTSAWRDGVIELELDAASMAVAEFPLVVDPLLTRTFEVGYLLGISYLDLDFATAEGQGANRHFVVSSFPISGTDSDVRCTSRSLPNAASTSLFYDISTEDSRNVSCAYVAGTDRWVLAWDARDGFGTRRIRAHVHAVTDLNLRTNTTSFINLSGVHDWRPDVGGTIGGSGPHAFVVFQRETTGGSFSETANSEVVGALLDTSTTNGTWNARVNIAGGGTVDAERPAVNQQAEGGSSGTWFCVHQAYNSSIVNDDWDLVGRRIDATGALLGGSWVSDLASGGGSLHQVGAQVAGSFGRYAVAFTTVETSVGKTSSVRGRDIWIECLDWSANSSIPSTAGNRTPRLLQHESARTLEATGIAFDHQTRSHWAPAWRDHSATSNTAYVTRCGFQGDMLEPRLPVYTALAGQTLSELPVNFMSVQGAFRLHYGWFDASEINFYNQALAHPSGAVIQNEGTACSPTTIQWFGSAPSNFAWKNALIGNRQVDLAVSGAAATDTHIVFMALSATNVPMPFSFITPGCTQLVPLSGAGALGNLPIRVGAQAIWSFPLVESLAGADLYFQDWIFHSGTNTFSATDRLFVRLAR